MNIGAIKFADPFFMLAPLAGYGDIAFRRLCREAGASLTVTEMISAKGLCYGNEKTEVMLRLAPCESPSCVQLFGSEPEFFAKALRLGVLDNFDIIDINMGCPVPKVTKCGEGGALMLDSVRACEIVRACVENGGGRPVTVKHRLGVSSITAPEFAAAVASAGASALTVHGRTVEQGYSGKANHDAVSEVVKAVSVPVIGNGDIDSREKGLELIVRYGYAGVAIGRAAVGNPAVFGGIRDENKLATALRHLDYAVEYLGENVAVRTMRKHMSKYISGVQGVKELRTRLYSIESADELRARLKSVQSIDRKQN